MDDESTGEALLARAAALGLPVIGRSAEGRPIFGGPLPAETAVGRPLVIMAGIHGDEPASVEAVLDLCGRWNEVRNEVRDQVGAVDKATGVTRGPVWLVPVLNPDGIARGAKNSARDVDLNRNFPARNFTTQHRPGYDPGPGPLSEPETQCFGALLDRLHPVAVVAVHAPFACINHDGPAASWAAAVANACGWPARADLGYPTPGSLGSWLGVDQGLPVLTIELPPGALAGFLEPAFRSLAASVRFAPDGPA